ncbi:MAG: thrombospondin type 3 repeat-containing protein [bacterium]|nr:thrombospondin type 3 repeat-containing protein [bacterium]
MRHSSLRLPLAALLVLASVSVGRAAAPTLQAYDFFLRSGHTLFLLPPTKLSAPSDSLTLTPGAPTLAAFPTFATTQTIGALLAPKGVSANELTNGAALLYLRASRSLPSCVTLALTLRGAESGTTVASTFVSGVTLRDRVNTVSVPFQFAPGAPATLADEPMQLLLETRIAAPCRAATIRLLYDGKGRPSRVAIASCTAPVDSPDLNGNGLPDVCEAPFTPDGDADGDGVPNGEDNCPLVANPDQADSDGNGIGDACDTVTPPPGQDDDDGDGVPNEIDNCVDVANPDQADSDGDGLGDACDPIVTPPGPDPRDSDGDGIDDADDNCPFMANADQSDLNGDGIGDLCQCTLPAPGRCIPGGGNPRTDCLAEFNTPGPVLHRRGGKVRRVLRCIDGDPVCDRDGTADGSCTFAVSLCFANDDPRLGACRAAEPRRIDILAAPDGLAGARLLALASGAGLEARLKGQQIVTPSATAGTTIGVRNTCTEPALVQVPAPTGRARRVRRWIRTDTSDARGRHDRDRLRLECVGRVR